MLELMQNHEPEGSWMRSNFSLDQKLIASTQLSHCIAVQGTVHCHCSAVLCMVKQVLYVLDAPASFDEYQVQQYKSSQEQGHSVILQ